MLTQSETVQVGRGPDAIGPELRLQANCSKLFPLTALGEQGGDGGFLFGAGDDQKPSLGIPSSINGGNFYTGSRQEQVGLSNDPVYK